MTSPHYFPTSDDEPCCDGDGNARCPTCDGRPDAGPCRCDHGVVPCRQGCQPRTFVVLDATDHAAGF